MSDNIEIMSDVLDAQWTKTKTFLNFYSMLSRLLSISDEKKNPFDELPRIFVEETDFDMCSLFTDDENDRKSSFYSLYRHINEINLQDIKRINNNSLFPTLHKNSLGYNTLYIYPFVDNFEVKGFLVLGKLKELEDERHLNHIELLCKCCEKIFYIFKSHNVKENSSEDVFKAFQLKEKFPDPVIVIENSGRIVWMNEKAKALLPNDKYNYTGKHIKYIFTGINWEDTTIKKENLQIHVGDKKFIFSSDSYPIPVDHRVFLTGIILRDITELKMAEEENTFREKMELLGMLSAGIAHDFNNMLTGILGYSSLLKNFLNHNEKLLKYVEVIERSAERASSLTKQLLNFARKQERPSQEFDISVVIEDSLLLLCESLKNITIERDLQAKKYILKGDESEFQHILLNLFMNAKEAMEGKGILKVGTKNVNIGSKEYLLITIEDTGKGIDEKSKENLFKPYYTTKKSKGNVGLGLYRVERTVKKYEGFIEIDSELGKGTRFSIYIPIHHEDRIKEDKNMSEKPVEKTAQKKSVLVVDDEDFIGDMFSIVLNKMGFDVVYCSRGDEALQYLKNRRFDCIILDIIMPGMKGDELLRELRRIGLEIPVVVSSGYMSEEQREKVKSLGVNYFLDKPFTEKKIVSTMQEILSN